MFSLCEFSLYDKMLQGSVKGCVWLSSFNLFFSLGRPHLENDKPHLSNYIDQLEKLNCLLFELLYNKLVHQWFQVGEK